MHIDKDHIVLSEKSDHFYVFTTTSDISSAQAGPLRIVDTKGFIKVQRARALALTTTAAHFEDAVAQLWDEMAVYQSEVIIRPDFYLCIGPRVMDFSSPDYEQLLLLMKLEISTLEPDIGIIVVAGNVRQDRFE